MSEALPVVVAITGASGAPYAVRLLQALVAAEQPVWLIVSAHGERLLRTESGIERVEGLRGCVGAAAWDRSVRCFDDGDRGALPASGSVRTAGMVICPCSMGTIAAIAHGTSRSLVERAADVALKERRRLVVVPRETPYSEIHLENLLRLTRAGAVVLPASPGFYHRPTRVEELVDFVVARVLDHLGMQHEVAPRWDGGPAPAE
ncbi:MAG TPA: flavin prenyltransferase UbiX [Gemmatimonadaceae bacterium]|nr:flavin prenyltransferase UbiX [Gemmatimonadaceae bacterium]